MRATQIVPRLGLPDYSKTISVGDEYYQANGSSFTIVNNSSDGAQGSCDKQVVHTN